MRKPLRWGYFSPAVTGGGGVWDDEDGQADGIEVVRI